MRKHLEDQKLLEETVAVQKEQQQSQLADKLATRRAAREKKRLAEKLRGLQEQVENMDQQEQQEQIAIIEEQQRKLEAFERRHKRVKSAARPKTPGSRGGSARKTQVHMGLSDGEGSDGGLDDWQRSETMSVPIEDLEALLAKVAEIERFMGLAQRDLRMDDRDAGWVGAVGVIEEIADSTLSKTEKVIKEFAEMILKLLKRPERLAVSELLPEPTSARRVFCNSYHVDTKAGMITVRRARLETPGEALNVVVHAAAYALSIAMLDDGEQVEEDSPAFMRSLHRCVAQVYREVYAKHGPKPDTKVSQASN